MKAITTSIIIAGFVSLLSSCSSLKSPYYIGEKVEFSENEIGNETVWRLEEDVYHVKIVSSNEVVVSTVNWVDRNKKFTTENHELVISELDDRLFINLKEDDLYRVLRITPAGQSIVFYMVDGDQLKKHIPSGKVEFTEKGDVYTLKGSKEEIDQFIRENITTIFNPDHVVVAELLSGELE